MSIACSQIDFPVGVLKVLFNNSSISEKNLLAGREICKQLCTEIDQKIIPLLWNQLKQNPPKGDIALKELAENIEQCCAIDAQKNHVSFFKMLNIKIVNFYGVKISSPHVPILHSDFGELQQKYTEWKQRFGQMTPLHKVWLRIAEQVTSASLNLPQTYEEIEAFFNDATNASLLDSIDYLNLRDLELDTLPPQLYKLKNLQILELSNNKFKSIPDLRPFTQLQSLFLNDNFLEDTSNLNRITKNLKVLDLHNNKIKKLPTLNTFINLEQLYLHDNQIQGKIPSLRSLLELKILNVRDNQITSIPLLNCQASLEILDATDNPIEPTHTVNVPNLHRLDPCVHFWQRIP